MNCYEAKGKTARGFLVLRRGPWPIGDILLFQGFIIPVFGLGLGLGFGITILMLFSE